MLLCNDRYKDEMVASQDDFAQAVNDLATLVNNFSQHTDLGRMDFIVGEVCR